MQAIATRTAAYAIAPAPGASCRTSVRRPCTAALGCLMDARHTQLLCQTAAGAPSALSAVPSSATAHAHAHAQLRRVSLLRRMANVYFERIKGESFGWRNLEGPPLEWLYGPLPGNPRSPARRRANNRVLPFCAARRGERSRTGCRGGPCPAGWAGEFCEEATRSFCLRDCSCAAPHTAPPPTPRTAAPRRAAAPIWPSAPAPRPPPRPTAPRAAQRARTVRRGLLLV